MSGVMTGPLAPTPNSQAALMASGQGVAAGDPCPARRNQWRMLMKVAIILTSHDRLGDTGDKTGFWLEELVAPYYTLHDAGVEIT